MKGDARRKFLKVFGIGVLSVTITYVFLTLMRDIRDNFMANIWTELGFGSDYSIFTSTETRTSIIVLAIMGCLVLVRRNIQALGLIHFIIFLGLLITGVSSLMFVSGHMHGDLWMQLIGLGLYMAYIPFNCIFFERLIAAFRIKGNVGFLIYFADAFGYLSSTIVMCGKSLLHLKLNWTGVYSQLSIFASVFGIVAIVFSFFYFQKKYHSEKSNYA